MTVALQKRINHRTMWEFHQNYIQSVVWSDIAITIDLNLWYDKIRNLSWQLRCKRESKASGFNHLYWHLSKSWKGSRLDRDRYLKQYQCESNYSLLVVHCRGIGALVQVNKMHRVPFLDNGAAFDRSANSTSTHMAPPARSLLARRSQIDGFLNVQHKN